MRLSILRITLLWAALAIGCPPEPAPPDDECHLGISWRYCPEDEEQSE